MEHVRIAFKTRQIGRPAGWIDELDGPCLTIDVYDELDEQVNYNFMYTFWKPTAEELAALNAGSAIRLGIGGDVHPVINLAVTTEAM